MFNKRKENEVMRILKTHAIKTLLYRTPHGDLELNRGKEEEDFYFTLDSVRLGNEEQKELSKLWAIN